MHSWNLEKIYSKQVTKSTPVPPPNRLRILGESVSLYRRKGDEYELIGDVDDDYYDSTLSRYIKLGSSDSAELRKTIKDILKTTNGNEGNNLNDYQSYVVAGNFDIGEANRQTGEAFIQQCIANNTLISVGDFLRQVYGNDIDVGNEYFSSAWRALPKAGVHNRAGAGELFLAFFCNGKKPTKGDLHVKDRNVEVKGFGGRLHKSKKVVKPKIIQELINKDLDNIDDVLAAIAKAVSDLSGADGYESDIKDILENNSNIREKVLETYSALTKRYFNIPNNDIFIILAGAVQLLAYKEDQGFDSIVAFSDSKNISENLLMQFIDLNDITTVAEMLIRLNSLDGKVRINFNGDGSGFTMELSSSSSGVESTGSKRSTSERKKLAASARKADTKDVGVGSLLDIQ